MSTEIAIGTMAAGVTWLRSFAVGSGMLAGRCRADPPSRADIDAMRAAADEAFAAADVPRPDHAVAVGGSAASLPTLVGPVLDGAALERALAALGAAPAAEVARRHGLAPERTELLPAGILVLDAAARRLGMPMRIGRGGLREGVVLELAGGGLTRMAKAQDIDVAPSEPYRHAAARIVRVRAGELFDYAEGVLDTRDIERVHDMRVASRRLRAVLEIFAPCFPRSEFKGVLRDVKQLADALGERRDPDVHIEALQAFSKALLAANKPGVARLVEDLRARQTRRQRGARRRARARGGARAARAPARARRRRRAAEPDEGRGAVKARRVKGLEPDGALADNAERIVRVRLDELCGFMPTAADPGEVVALHDMRIAAKRLRYILEVTGPCFGPYAKTATKLVKELQDLLGEIHDCDVQIPETVAFAERLQAADAAALHAAAGAAADLDPALLEQAPHARDHAGIAALATHLRARRLLLFDRFLELWGDYERKGFRARLEYAAGERADVHDQPQR